MMGNTFTLPVSEGANLGDRLSRWVGRWRNGGIEDYSASGLARDTAQWGARELFSVSEERIWLDALPSVFSGLRIVQISDIHHGLFLTQEMLEQAVRQANWLNPDI